MARDMKVGGKLMEDGQTYYARMRMTYLNENNVNTFSDYSPVLPFVYMAEHQTALAGDVDGSGIVDVDDVNAMINIILEMKAASDYPGVADLDGSGIVDVDDVNALINIILAN